MRRVTIVAAKALHPGLSAEIRGGAVVLDVERAETERLTVELTSHEVRDLVFTLRDFARQLARRQSRAAARMDDRLDRERR
jgi:hypothetical protein